MAEPRAARGPMKLADRVGSLTGLRRAGLAVLLGALADRFDAADRLRSGPARLVSRAGLVVAGCAQGRGGIPRRAFLSGWWFAVGYFATGLYWVAIAFWSMPRSSALWLIPVVIGGLAGRLRAVRRPAAWLAALEPRSCAALRPAVAAASPGRRANGSAAELGRVFPVEPDRCRWGHIAP